MLYFTRGEPDYLMDPIPMALVGSFEYAISAFLIFFHPHALFPEKSLLDAEAKNDGKLAPDAGA